MTPLVFSLAVRLRQLTADVGARLNDDERGGLSAEYIGLIVVIAALVSALAGNMDTVADTISRGMSTAINTITGGG